jgi:hypothetical protein
MKGQGLVECSCDALLAGAVRVSTSVRYERRYTTSWKDNLMPGLPLLEIEQDLRSGAGHELDGKLCAAHSSAALVVNTFGPWRTAPGSFTMEGIGGFRSIRFEATFPIWPSRTPPHLDLIAEGDVIVAVESKCTEWMTPKPALFSDSYEKLRPLDQRSSWGPWFEQMQRVRGCSQFFDAAQVIKHAFGLLSCYGTRDVRLVYVYWEPRNAGDWPQCEQHRRQAEDLAASVSQSTVQLIPMSYRELWDELEQNGHYHYLISRYDVEVPKPNLPQDIASNRLRA